MEDSLTLNPLNRRFSIMMQAKESDFRLFHRPFGKLKRKIIFVILLITNLVINLDHGAIPAATAVLKSKLDVSNSELGLLGSLLFFGITLGGFSATILFRMYSAKWIVCISLGCSCFFLYLFTHTSSFLILCLARTGNGFFQVFSLIYFPVWVDEYGIKELRTFWMSFLQLGAPLGTMLGYLIQAYFVGEEIGNEFESINPLKKSFTDSWKNAFYFQMTMLVILVTMIILSPDKFFDKSYKRSTVDPDEFKKEIDKNKILFKKWQEKNMKENMPQNFKSKIEQSLEKFGRFSDYSIFSVADVHDEIENPSYYSMITDVLSHKTYTYILLTICSLLFIITGIQFWISDYLITVLEINHQTVFLSFSFVCITAPVSGVIWGGYIIDQIGGYTKPEAIEILFRNAVYAGGFGLLIPLIDTFFIFMTLCWFLLFFGASIVPGLTGIMLNSIGNYPKAVANSLTNIFYHLIGYFPAPFLYGFICTITGGSKSRWGLRFLMIFTFVGIYFLYLAKEEKKNEATNGKNSHSINHNGEKYEEEKEIKFESFEEHDNNSKKNALISFGKDDFETKILTK